MAVLLYGLDQIILFPTKPAPLTGKDMSDIYVLKRGAVLVAEGRILSVGSEKNVFAHPRAKKAKKMKIRGVALPSFVDSHTHSVFGEPRLKDFSMRVSGFSYGEIRKKGGGIISSIKAVREKSGAELERRLISRCARFLECGTGFIEVKTGYGLDFESEIKCLRAVQRARKKTPLEMLPTLLSAHSVPPEFKGRKKKYLNYIYSRIMPYVSKLKLAVFADIFCEKNFFSYAEAIEYLNTARRFGLRGKIHAEQLSAAGGIRAAAETGAISADHSDFASDADIKTAAGKKIILTLLPTSNYYLGINKFPDARKMIEKGAPVALATDFNPGSSPCWNMQEVMSMSAIYMKMTPEEVVTASTLNGAAALGISDRVGSISEGKQADISVFDVKDYREISYYFGANLNKVTIKKGSIVYGRDKTGSF